MRAHTSVTRSRATPTLLAAAAILTVLTVLVELQWGVPVKLPGHRALPGALCLLVVAECATPWMLLAYALAVPLAIAGLGGGELVLVVPWLGLALLLVASTSTRWRKHFWFMVAAGLAYGALRFGVLLLGPHKTPQLVRVVGHLLFGGLGGLLAAFVVKANRSVARSDEEPR